MLSALPHVELPPRGQRRPLSLLPALGLLLLPKCPVCLAAYGGVLGAVGLLPWLRAAWTPLITALVLLALGPLVLRLYRRREPGPLLLGLAGVSGLLWARFLLDSVFLLYAGAALLAGASLWNAWPRFPFQPRAPLRSSIPSTHAS